MSKPKRKRCPCTSCIVTEDKTVWRRESFNSRSSDQVQDLLESLGIRVPTKRNKEGEIVKTTGKKQLQRLSKKNEQLRPILLIRSKSTLRQNYDWNIDVDGRIRTYYGYNPSTWRLSSWYNNLAVIPRRGELSHRVRRLIKAAPGHILGECDSSGIEACLVGYYAKSDRYIRLAKAGVHGYLTAIRMGQQVSIDLPFDELQRVCKYAKKLNPKLYDTIKPIVHGCLTAGHEVLTPLGWLPIEKYNGETVAQWHDGEISFVQGTPRKFEHSGYLIEMRGRGIDATMTPDHRVPVKSGFSEFCVRASELLPSYSIPINGVMREADNLNVSRRDIQLAVAIQADATIDTSGAAIFHLVRKRKVKRLRKLLKGRGFKDVPCRCHKGGRRIRLPFSNFQGISYLLSSDKHFSWSVLALSQNQRVTFLDELSLWDGSIKGYRVDYKNTDKSAHDVIQALAHISGRQAILRPTKRSRGAFGNKQLWTTSFNRRKYAKVAHTIREKLAYDGPVYCLTVPSGFFLVRYNNRVSVTGNSNYDESAWGIYEQNPDEFDTPQEAEELRRFYFSTEPGRDVVRWQEEVRQQAHSQRCLQNAYGVKHWFWSVFAFNQGKGIWEPDSAGDGKRSVAFLPQSTAACMNREYALTFAEKYPQWVQYMRLFTYDSISLEWPPAEFDNDPILALADVMSMKLPTLGGLSIGVEAKVGDDLENMSEIKL